MHCAGVLGGLNIECNDFTASRLLHCCASMCDVASEMSSTKHSLLKLALH